MRWTAIGLALGLGASLGVRRPIAGFLYGVGPADPVAFAAITVLMAAITGEACYVPARRASRIDPLSAMRGE
jgi:putative ABC transport system permease protein